ncbi:UDP-N-acetylmuramoyl-L-alanine--D-glutamate ligase [Actinomyces faecalis]|uniref:UDP-N-acetylmuramoyl-L-alanine--D-glutamate ligase n=1 Tax=Actinomyces faecalis TaxID=2722820 RepID=UPI00155452B9|nr:UDP-N-acetylmuramoyl-L-alanine--D-glutamate ligase [Actinomyces faecalis]
MSTTNAVTYESSDIVKDLAGAQVGVVGLGRTGTAVVEVLSALGARVSVFDSRQDAVQALPAGTRPVAAAVGDDAALAQALVSSDLRLLVVSPGVPATGALMQAARARGIETWSEIELAWRLHRSTRPEVPWITVTGTDGKTTTVGMLSAILTAAGMSAPAVGNIGVPTISVVAEGKADALAVELSSFQLHATHSLSPLAAACLNLSADHLDWHGSMEAYAADKARVYTHAQRGVVYNLADPATLRMVEEADVVEGCRAVGFGLGAPGPGQVGLVEDVMVDRAWYPRRHHEAAELATLADLEHLAPGGRSGRLPAHVVADALAAASLALAHDRVQADPGCVARGLRAFVPGAHRLVTVAQGDGVTWVDDSKATNAHSARAALTSVEPGTAVWIVGGDTKGADLHPLVASVRGYLRGAVVIGADPTEVVQALQDEAPQVPLTVVRPGEPGEVMDEAVRLAAATARSGDTVLLAPAAASWDQFRSYAERGDLFARAARLQAGAGQAGRTVQDDQDRQP